VTAPASGPARPCACGPAFLGAHRDPFRRVGGLHYSGACWMEQLCGSNKRSGSFGGGGCRADSPLDCCPFSLNQIIGLGIRRSQTGADTFPHFCGPELPEDTYSLFLPCNTQLSELGPHCSMLCARNTCSLFGLVAHSYRNSGPLRFMNLVSGYVFRVYHSLCVAPHFHASPNGKHTLRTAPYELCYTDEDVHRISQTRPSTT
jgi:hypothetical protein